MSNLKLQQKIEHKSKDAKYIFAYIYIYKYSFHAKHILRT